MFKGEAIHISKSIRFKRWSRKNFAVFAGLKANIVIGRLATDIVDRLLPKTKTIEANLSANAILNCKERSDEEMLSIENPLVAVGQLSSTLCPSFLNKVIAATSVEGKGCFLHTIQLTNNSGCI